MRLSSSEARARFASSRVARLASVRPDGAPHVVPIVFALDGNVLYSVVDAKPKRTTSLQRLANVTAEPRVGVLADEYAEDWTQLWWARGDGRAQIAADASERAAALELLRARYPQYRTVSTDGPLLRIDIDTWTGWSAS